MSIVGNYTTSYDREARLTGAGAPSRPRTGWERDLREAEDDEYVARNQLKLQRTQTDASDADSDVATVRDLARAYSQHETYGDPFNAAENPKLDPNSPSFDPRAWARSLMQLSVEHSDHDYRRTAGFSFRDLSAFGQAETTDYQMTAGNAWLKMVGAARRKIGNTSQRINILRSLDGLVNAGEMLIVLGPPGSGCSTFLKTVAGETHGFQVADGSQINYQGISAQQMRRDFRGEAIYTAEQDIHFPMLTVGDTLTFAARARAPRQAPGGVPIDVYTKNLRDVVMAIFGIQHTVNTKVGNDFVRGVSGGERKRVSIAEAALSGAPLQCWDNSTRGLDSANAIEFCRALRLGTDLGSTTAAVAIYQAPQLAYDLFDKVLLLYEGHQIYFGSTRDARAYFEAMGFVCPSQQTTADFLTSMTSSKERVIREGWETRVPRTAEDFAQRWKDSSERKILLRQIDTYNQQHPFDGQDVETFKDSRRHQQSRMQRVGSPYTLSYFGQMKLCIWRSYRRIAANPSLPISQISANFVMALIVSSIFYNLQPTTDSFNTRSALLFFGILLNAFGAALEILTLYAQRPIIEKHTRYAFYHPSAEAFASMFMDLPTKAVNAICFNLVIYFIPNLRREPGAFFFFLLVTFTLTLVMSMLFRTIGSLAKSMPMAQTPSGIMMLAIIMYTGFVIPIPDMHGWARWINYLDPVAYGFEALMVNEFSGRDFSCSQISPSGPGYGTSVGPNQICATVGGVAGQAFVSGDAYINTLQYYAQNKWRDYGILWVFLIGFLFTYLAAAEFVPPTKSKGEVLLFRRGKIPSHLTGKGAGNDPELARKDTRLQLEQSRANQDISTFIQKQTAVFHWSDVCYDIKIKGESRRILDHVNGWVKPGTMTALMGVSGAGKTTLLDVLASRVTTGVISGEMLVDGKLRDESFQRQTGYVQQQDLHLETATVREALNFSAILRQSASISRNEKLAYVEEVIHLLEMDEYADAVIGTTGEGLNVEQRKRLTIAVEMVAKPQLLLFLDEPTSGLDSQTSWSILDLLEKLAKNGQAILCTIHQPSAMLFQRFDRLLLLAAGGKTVYFGPIGEDSKNLAHYFEQNGARSLQAGQNPAEWMLEVIGATPNSEKPMSDWHETWKASSEFQNVEKELRRLKGESATIKNPDSSTPPEHDQYREFAAPFLTQLGQVQKRVFQQYWRTPSYIYSKLALSTLVPLFIGFSFFKADNTQSGLKNQLYGVFMLISIFNQLVQQIIPLFVTQRSLYEIRERPSKTYSWVTFMVTNIVVEIPWATLSAIFVFFCWYYPIGLYANAEPTGTVMLRGFQEFLFIWQFMLLGSTFSFLVAAGLGTSESASNLGNILFSMSLIFCGALVGPSALPRFWIFMYRVSPCTYLVEGLLTTAVAGAAVTCSGAEFRAFPAPAGSTCGEYMRDYIAEAGGYLVDSAASQCQYCPIDSTDTFLGGISMSFTHAWRDFGILWAYILVNIAGAVAIYWLVRVPKKAKKE